MLISPNHYEPTRNTIVKLANNPANFEGKSQSWNAAIDHPDQTRIIAQIQTYLIAKDFFTELPLTNFIPKMLEILLPLEVDLTYLIVHGEERTQLETKLEIAFETNPLEDGVFHQAEHIIDSALKMSINKDHLLNCLGDMTMDTKFPNFSASVLRCLSRLQLGESTWRIKIIQSALSSGDIEVRDAAIQAAETWRDSKLREILKHHNEPIPWLRAYIDDVVVDLER